MSLRIILIVSGAIGILFGLFFLVGAESAIQSYGLGDSTLPARLFARATGASIVSLGLINILASPDKSGSTVLRAIAIGNIVIHVISLGVDFSEAYERNAGVWVSVTVHVLIIAAFAYALMNWQKVARAA